MKCTFGEIELSQLQLVCFDLDDTLAPSKSALPPEMTHLLEQLMQKYQVCIISGGQLGQFRTQVLEQLELATRADARKTLHLMPTCGTQYYCLYPGATELSCQYVQDLPPELRVRAATLLEECARNLGLWEENPWGEIIEDRGTQVTYSALGQYAPLAAKRAWDPTGAKKLALSAAVATLLPELEVRGGGSSSVDVTAKGIDKAYGINALQQTTGLASEEILFIGDRLDRHGNDYPVVSTGVACQAVADWTDSLQLIQKILGN